MLRIDQDLGRFKDIVKGRVRRELRKYMSSGELIGKQGDKLVSIPIPRIGIPRLRYGDNDKGVGQGDDGGPGQGQQPGEEGGEHTLEVDVTMEELAELLGQELQLPNIEPKGTKSARTFRTKYKGIARTGPESLRHTKRTYRAAMQRTIASGGWDPRRPVIIPHKDDRRYRSFKEEQEPRSAALILYMMDVSGSMGQEQKDIVRSEAFWIDLWIRRFYQDVETRFIIHDATAREVDRETFFRTRESGGTLISSAYKLAVEIIEKNYAVDEWNIYPFHFSDGDNWSQSDTRLCLQLLKDKLIPWSNQFSYAQVDSQYGSGQFLKDLAGVFSADPKVALSRVANRDGILDSIRHLLSRGN
jgi:uncharacterized sporulation protein YeaH/YhbH (DUF444 family)